MRQVALLFAAAMLLTGTAAADENLLFGGALIVHHEAAIAYTTTTPPGGWCAQYVGHEIYDPAQEVIRIDGPGYFTWFILAAWDEDKLWCGTEFGFGYYDPSVWVFAEVEPCFPDQGLELPTANWPGPNEGTALVTTTTAWEGNWVPVYWLSGYAYAGGTGSTAIPISFDPGSINSFCGFSNCTNPPQDYVCEENAGTDIRRGAMGINTDGLRAAPVSDPVGVCCVGTWCVIQTQAGCDDFGGEWHPEWDSCEGNPCDPVHVCCFGTVTISCVLATQSQCASMPGGEWLETLDDCDPDPCKLAACCTGSICTLRTELECYDAGGDYWLEFVGSCTPNPCLEPEAACCVGELCTIMTFPDCATIGGTWYELIDTCDPNPCIPSACCYGYEQCALATLGECNSLPGVWHPEYASCTPTPCADRACCFEGGVCIVYSEAECLAAGGVWMSDSETCIPNPCARVCCTEGECQLTTQEDCLVQGGDWFPEWTSCSPNPCPQIYTVAPDGSGDFPTIQLALDAVSPGAIIELTDGVFSGIGNRDLDFAGKPVRVRSQSRNPAVCIIDCGGAFSEPHRGFDFHSGEGSGSIVDGVTIRGGLLPSDYQGSQGAGVRCVNASPTLFSCVILANRADHGAGIYCEEASPIIGHCTIAGNLPAGSEGSAIALVGASAPAVENSIIAFNDQCQAFACDPASAPVLSCCDIFGNPGGDWTGVIGSQYGVNGNTSADPVFCDLAGGNAHLSCDSPCIDREGCGQLGALPEGCVLYGITSVGDIPNDQGRQVRIQWHRTCTDVAGGDPVITAYSLWRRIDEGDAASAQPAPPEEVAPASYPPGEWEYVSSLPASGELTYAVPCPTLCDSTIAAGMCWSVFFVRAHTSVPTIYFDTEPDSGYSLDDLAPEAPGNLQLVTPTLLTWDASGAPDFDYFTVYGSTSGQLDSTAVVLGYTTGTFMVFEHAFYACYHVTATDFSGNEGLASTVCDYSNVSTTGVIPSSFALGPVLPNPMRASTRIQLDIPTASEVDLRVYDAAGRLVSTLVAGQLPAGCHVVDWDRLSAGAPRVPSGIYFLHVRAGRFSARRAIVVLD